MVHRNGGRIIWIYRCLSNQPVLSFRRFLLRRRRAGLPVFSDTRVSAKTDGGSRTCTDQPMATGCFLSAIFAKQPEPLRNDLVLPSTDRRRRDRSRFHSRRPARALLEERAACRC